MEYSLKDKQPELVRQITEHALIEATSLIHVVTRGEITTVLLSEGDILAHEGPGLTPDPADTLVLVRQPLHGAASGYAALVMELDCARELIRDLLGKCASISDLTEFEQESLSEIANILLNSCLSNYGNLRQQPLGSGPPRMRVGPWSDLLAWLCDQEIRQSLFCVRVKMSAAPHACHACLVFDESLFG